MQARRFHDGIGPQFPLLFHTRRLRISLPSPALSPDVCATVPPRPGPRPQQTTAPGKARTISDGDNAPTAAPSNVVALLRTRLISVVIIWKWF